MIFLQKIAPKTKPKPQLNQLTIKVVNVIINVLLALLLQKSNNLLITLSIGLLIAKTCPNNSINIICTANARPFTFHKPLYQDLRIYSILFEEDGVSKEMLVGQKKASTNVNKVNMIAIENGDGNRKRIPFIYFSIRDI